MERLPTDHENNNGNMSMTLDTSNVSNNPQDLNGASGGSRASSLSGTLRPSPVEKDIEKDIPNSPSTLTTPAPPTDPNLVNWTSATDPSNPQNWSSRTRWLYTMLLAMMTWIVTFASSVFSTGTLPFAAEYHISTEVATLGTSLFVLGIGLGPTVWGPLSELYGRKSPMFISFAGFAIFQIPVAVAQNVETVMLCRFFGGFFGVGPLAICGGAFADMWGPVDRGVAIAVFCGATFVGPVAGPIMGGFITQSYLGWRWTAWITLIMACAFGLLGFVLVPETYAPVLLKRRAQKLRFETQNWAIHAKIEESPVSFADIINKYIFRPSQMIITEPILVLITAYQALIYGILFLFFEAYPISFQEERGWNDGVGALPFLSIFVGIMFGAVLVAVNNKRRYARLYAENGRVEPEERLVLMMVAAVVLPIGLFWFAWTSDPNITWVPQVLAGAPIGFGLFVVFLQGINYIIDVYLMFANSAIAANTFFRSLFGAGFPLFAVQMYHKLGVNWASSLLAFLCVLMAPIPFLFYRYGARIRTKSRFSPKF